MLKLPLTALFFQGLGFLFAMFDYEGKCVSGEKQYYSTSVFQGVGLMHAMTAIAILLEYYFLRNISLLLGKFTHPLLSPPPGGIVLHQTL